MRAGKELLYLPNERMVFFLSAKCASSSVRRMALDDLGYRDDNDEKNSGLWYLQPEDLEVSLQQCRSVIVCRNPWDRLVSLWTDKTQRTIYNGFRQFDISKGIEFKRFVEIVYEIPDDEADPHLWPQTIFALSDDGALLPAHVIRFERLERDWEMLRAYKPELPRLRHFNKSRHHAYRRYYDPITAVLVEKRYERDIDVFEYSF